MKLSRVVSALAAAVCLLAGCGSSVGGGSSDSSGTLRVTLGPAGAVTAGVGWTLDAGTTVHASGDAVSHLTLGSHTVHFVSAGGWTAPASQVVVISQNATATAAATFVATGATGAARVTLAPGAVVTAGARWSIDGQAALQISGATVAGLAPGNHTVHFSAVGGYTAPADQVLNVLSNGTATTVGTYTAVGATGSVRVTLAPGAAVTAGARWTLDSQATQRISGTTVTGVAAGAHTVHFSTVNGYTTPADQTLTVPSGGTATGVGTYTAVGATGLVRVTMSPGAAVTAGARWTLDGVATQRTSGTTLSGVAVGNHTVKFTAVAGYTTPADQTVTVAAGGTATVVGTYTAAAISFATTVEPLATAGCSCHGSTMTTRSTLIASGRVVPGNAAASSYVQQAGMQANWGSAANRQTVIDWINQGANP